MPTFEEVDTEEVVNTATTATPALGTSAVKAEFLRGHRVRFSPRSSLRGLTSRGRSIAFGSEGTVAADSFRSLPPMTRVEFDGVAPGDWADVYLHELPV